MFRRIFVRTTLSFLIALPIFFALAGSDAAAALQAAEPSEAGLLPHAEESYRRGLQALTTQDRLEPDAIWVLQQVLRSRPDPELERFVQARIDDHRQHPMRKLVLPDSPRFPLPETPGRGIERLTTYTMAPFGAPEERALAFIAEFLSNESSGYILTHQLLVLEWARQAELELPAALAGQRRNLIERMAREQAAEPEFSDLFAERAALLLLYARPAPEVVRQWISRIVDRQHADGTWGRHSFSVTYDSETVLTEPQTAHTLVLSLLVLRLYLDRY